MTGMKQFFGCAVLGAIVIMFCSTAGAQFRGGGGPEGTAEAQAEKSLIAEGCACCR